MPRSRATIAAGTGAALLVVGAVAWALWLRSDQRVTRAAISTDSIVMLGDSITEQGPWESAFPNRSIVNQGHAGFTTAQLVEVAQDIAPARPRVVYLLAGTNDIRDGHRPAWTVHEMAKIVDAFESATPTTLIVIQTILPRQDFPDEVRAANEAIRDFASERNLDVLELHAAFDDGSGGLRPQDTSDGLHLSSDGNRRWAAILRDHYTRH